MGLPNLARIGRPSEHPDVDETIRREMREAGILPFDIKTQAASGEVPTSFMGGEAHRWGFVRAWRYYVATGPGIPPIEAESFHARWGKECRGGGHAGCPSPLEWCHGFAVSLYHIDTQEALNAFVLLLAEIDAVNDAPKETNNG